MPSARESITDEMITGIVYRFLRHRGFMFIDECDGFFSFDGTINREGRRIIELIVVDRMYSEEALELPIPDRFLDEARSFSQERYPVGLIRIYPEAGKLAYFPDILS